MDKADKKYAALQIELPEEVSEPNLVYFKPVAKPALTAPSSSLVPNYAIRNPPLHCGQPLPPRFHPFLQNQNLLLQSQPQPSGICYPLTSVSQSYIPYQQMGAGDQLQSYLSTDSYQNIMTTDSLIQEEVTRAAKTLFSKRNRTLLHWLNPGVSKGQLKIDVNAAWDSLPQTEKLFYISQVLGKFAPHTTSLMVNPQLEPNGQAVSQDIICKSTEFPIRKSKKQHSKKQQMIAQDRRKVILLNDDDISCDSGLVVDTDAPKTKKTKRQYNRKKPKEKVGKSKNEIGTRTDTNYTVETVQEVKATQDEIKLSDEQIKTELADKQEIKSQTQETTQQHNKKEPTNKKLKNQPPDSALPRVKRKYVKRKLVRKKYTRRKPKDDPLNSTAPKIEETCEKSNESFNQQINESSEDIDIWIDLETDVSIENFNLLNEEVDSFWDSIEDPNSLFMELDME